MKKKKKIQNTNTNDTSPRNVDDCMKIMLFFTLKRIDKTNIHFDMGINNY